MANDTERTPAEELRAAANTLRETAKRATGGPWTQLPGAGNIWHFPDEELTAPRIVAEGVAVRTDDGAWMTLVHPGVAEPLAEMLENISLTLGRPGHREWHATEKAALAAARIINGGEPGA